MTIQYMFELYMIGEVHAHEALFLIAERQPERYAKYIRTGSPSFLDFLRDAVAQEAKE